MQEWTCKACGERTSSQDGIQQKDGVYYVVCSECGGKNKVVQIGGGAGSPTQLTIVGVIQVRVIYSTSKKFEVGGMHHQDFPNLQQAKDAALPSGFTFALINTEEGRWHYEPSFGWNFTEQR